jgi:hypothetical protein
MCKHFYIRKILNKRRINTYLWEIYSRHTGQRCQKMTFEPYLRIQVRCTQMAKTSEDASEIYCVRQDPALFVAIININIIEIIFNY